MRRYTVIVLVLLLAAIASPVGAQGTSGARISGQVGDPTVDPAAELVPGAWLRYTGQPAPDDYSHDYQWAPQRILTPSPESSPITIEGSLDLSQRVVGATATIGLYDVTALAAGDRSYQEGAYVYVSVRQEGVVIFGPTDGNRGGEIIQRFIANADITGPVDFTFVVDGTADPATCANRPADVPTADGCLTLTISGFAPIVDSYGTIVSPNGPAVEFADGAVPGWDGFTDDGQFGPNGIGYDATITPFVINDPTTEEVCKDGGWADFGFRNQGQCIRFVNTGRDSR